MDFGKRNTEKDYREMLKRSGIMLRGIRIETGVSQTDTKEHLTFGSYVNEPGISQKEHDERYEKFWIVSQYRKDLAY